MQLNMHAAALRCVAAGCHAGSLLRTTSRCARWARPAWLSWAWPLAACTWLQGQQGQVRVKCLRHFTGWKDCNVMLAMQTVLCECVNQGGAAVGSC
jgi:hypothetical protein